MGNACIMMPHEKTKIQIFYSMNFNRLKKCTEKNCKRIIHQKVKNLGAWLGKLWVICFLLITSLYFPNFLECAQFHHQKYKLYFFKNCDLAHNLGSVIGSMERTWESEKWNFLRKSDPPPIMPHTERHPSAWTQVMGKTRGLNNDLQVSLQLHRRSYCYYEYSIE